MSKKALKLVEQAVREAKAQGITVWRGNGAIFDWTGPDKTKPIACDATGAILLAMGRTKWVAPEGTVYGEGEDRGSWKDITSHLGVNEWWWYRFFRGWSYSRPIEIAILNDKGQVTGWREDDVGRSAYKLAKRLTGR